MQGDLSRAAATPRRLSSFHATVGKATCTAPGYGTTQACRQAATARTLEEIIMIIPSTHGSGDVPLLAGAVRAECPERSLAKGVRGNAEIHWFAERGGQRPGRQLVDGAWRAAAGGNALHGVDCLPCAFAHLGSGVCRVGSAPRAQRFMAQAPTAGGQHRQTWARKPPITLESPRGWPVPCRQSCRRCPVPSRRSAQ